MLMFVSLNAYAFVSLNTFGLMLMFVYLNAFGLCLLMLSVCFS